MSENFTFILLGSAKALIIYLLLLAVRKGFYYLKKPLKQNSDTILGYTLIILGIPLTLIISFAMLWIFMLVSALSRVEDNVVDFIYRVQATVFIISFILLFVLEYIYRRFRAKNRKTVV